MVRTLLIRGLLAGTVAGLVAAVFAYAVGEPAVDRALAFEAQLAQTSGEPSGAALVSREVQRTIGLLAGTTLYGVALGGLFSLVFATVSGRLVRLTPRATAALLALTGFLVVILVPFLKYPANPPAATVDTTIVERTSFFWIMVLSSVLAAAAAAALAARLVDRFGVWAAGEAAVGSYLLVMTVVGLTLPGARETPAGFPADALYEFRVASLGIQLVLWTTLGLLFGALTDRSLRSARSATPVG